MERPYIRSGMGGFHETRFGSVISHQPAEVALTATDIHRGRGCIGGWVNCMPIEETDNTHTQAGARARAGAPMGLIAWPSCRRTMLFFFGYNYWRYKSLDQIDTALYPILLVPVVLGYVLYRSQRRLLSQIASVSEAVEVAASGRSGPDGTHRRRA